MKRWIKAASIRAAKTMAQTAAGLITTGAVMSAIDWRVVISTAIVSGIYSLLTSVNGLPELDVQVPTEEVDE